MHDVRAHGAVGDGVTDDTAAVQRAIDACGETGGTVLFSPGVYRSATLHLRSRMALRLEQGATLLGSDNRDDYDPYEELGFKNDADHETSFFRHALLFGEGLEHVAIVGGGLIDANFTRRGGPKPIALRRCRFVSIRDIHILNAPNYTISLLGTDDVHIDGVTILNGYCDGIDPDSCRNVRISNCRIESIDDAIVPKASFSLGERRACENITVTNCVLSTVCNGFKLGTESGGGFKRIAVSNCVITGYRDNRPAISGIALESVDGGDLDGVVVSNITMDRVRAPIFIRLGNRGRDMETPVPGALRNVSISNIVATRASFACSVTGIPDARVQGVTLSDIRVAFVGGNAPHPVDKPVMELARVYPEALMFRTLPAYGLFCRHVEGLALRNIDFTYADDFWRITTDVYRDVAWPDDDGAPAPSEPGEPGLALYCENVRGLRIDGFTARQSADGAPLMLLKDAPDALVDGRPAPAEHGATP
ncbi:MAG TPA: glycosyl hydrolase family 28 protein [Candidatus Hydrogenedentes bacterium]|nr:glycosyl hydrolase family 28 protein [Candidatus Hydrogenedentota bacterium]